LYEIRTNSKDLNIVNNAIVNLESFIRDKKSSLSTIESNETIAIDLSTDINEIKPPSNRYTIDDVKFSNEYNDRFEVFKDIELIHDVNELKNAEYGNVNDIAFTRSGNSFTFSTIETLRPKKCINSQIIEVMVDMLYDRHVAKTKNQPTIIYLHNFFFKDIMKDGIYTFKLSKFKHMPTIDKIEYLFIPVHQGCHFFLMVYNFKTKTIKYYDSMFNEDRGNEYSKLLLTYIYDLYGHYHMNINKDEIKIDICKDLIPQQKNSYDCGVFTILFVDFLIDGIDFKSLNYKHIYSFRDMILYNLYKNKLSY